MAEWSPWKSNLSTLAAYRERAEGSPLRIEVKLGGGAVNVCVDYGVWYPFPGTAHEAMAYVDDLIAMAEQAEVAPVAATPELTAENIAKMVGDIAGCHPDRVSVASWPEKGRAFITLPRDVGDSATVDRVHTALQGFMPQTQNWNLTVAQ